MKSKGKSFISIIIIILFFVIYNFDDIKVWINDLLPQNTEQNKNNNTKKLADLEYRPKTQAYKIIDNDYAKLPEFKYKVPHINYQKLDYLNRAKGATAYLTKQNLGKSKGRESQTFKPTGWFNQPKKINRTRVFPVNRGHLIAYTFSFNLDNNGNYHRGLTGSIDNPKNLFTQTAFSNQRVMQITENKVRNALKNNYKVVYRATPIYRGNELMARGVLVQAESTNKKLHFNRFLYNVQPDLDFDYATGRSKINQNMQIPYPEINYTKKNYHVNKKWKY
ncbi:DNA/RNA non-specific endonuclease [Lactobacillus sp. S2-2]|uniref:DNA/RNA non-specific endonuclease n=1 Tax=Lactobacillus sp. S2-2 TaxID=2692917 RepID=UPI001F2596B2|nr:DNA/RNA non-specific endonuclease [Lactobacillus sp. S2-2]MCF6515473.1 DNA/RNA non-specific endonuclease [Lactobacillus sp. S2-2]